MTPALFARGVSIRFGGLAAVSNFELALPVGGLYGLIGPNGAGKTTLFTLLTGVYRPDQGEIRLGERDLIGSAPSAIAASGLARTFQNIRLFHQLSALDNVRVAQFAHRRTGLVATLLRTPAWRREEEADRAAAEAWLTAVGLEGRGAELARNLPYGDQRRLEIARALALRPKVLLLDEPAAGMNPQEKLGLRSLIRTLRDTYDLSILLIEHDMGLVMDVCEHITVLDHGEVIARGTAAEVQVDPAVVEAYLGSPEAA